MNNEQAKTLGQIAFEAFDSHQDLGDPEHWYQQPPTVQGWWEAAAAAVISHVLQGAKWMLLEIGEEIRPGDEFFDYNRPLDFRWVKCSMGVVGDKIDEHHFIHRRPISLTHGATEGDSTTPPVSSGDAGTDVPAGMEACPMCGGLGDDESHRIAMLGMGEPSIAKPCSLCRGSGVVQSAEPVVEDDEKPSLELMTASRNEYYEMYAAQRSYAMGLESERDQLRKELEDWRSDRKASSAAFRAHIKVLTTENAALKEKLDRWQAVGNSVMKVVTGKEGPLSDSDVEAELTRLRSQFHWIPISERLPTEKDAIDGMLWMRTYISGDVRHRHWTDASSFDLWMTPILPPAPSPETEEQAMRREFESHIRTWGNPERDLAVNIADGSYVYSHVQSAWTVWQAAKSTGGPS